MQQLRIALAFVIVVIFLTSARPAACQKLLQDGVRDLATQISAKVTKEQKRKIAVLPFKELDGRPTVLGSYLAEALVSGLFDTPGLDIVERAMLDKLIGEFKLDRTGLIDPLTAKHVGKVAGVDAIVTGTITELASTVAVNCRLIDAQTGRVFAAAETRFVKDDDVRKIMGAPASGSSGQGQQEVSAPAQRSKSKELPPTERQAQSKNDYPWRFTVKKCSHIREEERAACEILVTNVSNDKLNLLFNAMYASGGRICYLSDSEGKQYKSRVEQSAVAVSLNPAPEFLPHVAQAITINFDHVPESLSQATLVIQADQGLFGRKLTEVFTDITID